MPIKLDQYYVELFKLDQYYVELFTSNEMFDSITYELDIRDGDHFKMLIQVGTISDFETFEQTLKTLYDSGMSWEDIKNYYEL